MPAASPDVTQLLAAWPDRNEAALDRLAPLVCGEVHQPAHARKAVPSGHIPSERDRWVTEILDWLDQHLGPVNRR